MYALISLLALGFQQPVDQIPPADEAPRLAVVVEPRQITVGETVSVKFNFAADKVLITGGRFPKGRPVTNKTRLDDKPTQSTVYIVDAWYRPQAPGETKPAAKQIHVRYTASVNVLPSLPAPTVYKHKSGGWQVQLPKGWRADGVSLPNPKQNALVFLQPTEDSIERIAISIMPYKKNTCSELIQDVLTSAPSSYEKVESEEPTQTQLMGADGSRVIFKGIDNAHPGKRSKSLVLACVKDGIAYVLSARTLEQNFVGRVRLFEKMLKSFKAGS
jgi:hypothetical protein